MTFLHLVIVLVVIGGCAAIAAGRVHGGLSAPTSSLPEVTLTADTSDPVAPADVDAVRFSVGFRGYRMDEVDAVLDRLSAEISQRDTEIAHLRDQLAPEPVTETPEPSP